MLRFVKGDILMSQAQSIAHGIAPNEHFDHGLALQLRENWPAMAKDYRHYAHQVHPKSGEIWTWSGSGGKHIINMLTQEGDHGHGSKPGKATLAHLNHCLRRLRAEVEKLGVKSLALPRLATGVGGLEWNEVKPLIEQHLGDFQGDVEVYAVYQAKQAAVAL